jgi:hypothetical protein
MSSAIPSWHKLFAIIASINFDDDRWKEMSSTSSRQIQRVLYSVICVLFFNLLSAQSLLELQSS